MLCAFHAPSICAWIAIAVGALSLHQGGGEDCITLLRSACGSNIPNFSPHLERQAATTNCSRLSICVLPEAGCRSMSLDRRLRRTVARLYVVHPTHARLLSLPVQSRAWMTHRVYSAPTDRATASSLPTRLSTLDGRFYQQRLSRSSAPRRRFKDAASGKRLVSLTNAFYPAGGIDLATYTSAAASGRTRSANG